MNAAGEHTAAGCSLQLKPSQMNKPVGTIFSGKFILAIARKSFYTHAGWSLQATPPTETVKMKSINTVAEI